jgi:hypothetical protein
MSETGINRGCYTPDKLRRDLLYVLPTTVNASDFSSNRSRAGGWRIFTSPIIRPKAT